MSHPDCPLLLFLQEPWRGHSADYQLQQLGCRQFLLKKWYLPPQLHSYLDDLVQAAAPIMQPVVAAQPGSIVGLVVVELYTPGTKTGVCGNMAKECR